MRKALLLSLAAQAGCAQAIWNERVFECAEFQKYVVHSTALTVDFGTIGGNDDGECVIFFREIAGARFQESDDNATLEVTGVDDVQVTRWSPAVDELELDADWTESAAIEISDGEGGRWLSLQTQTPGTTTFAENGRLDVTCEDCAVGFNDSSRTSDFVDVDLRWDDNAEIHLGGGLDPQFALYHGNSDPAQFPALGDVAATVANAAVTSGPGQFTYTAAALEQTLGAVYADCGPAACVMEVVARDAISDVVGEFGHTGYVFGLFGQPMDRIRFEGAGQQLPVDLQVSSAVQSLYVENTDGDIDISVPLSSYDLEISTVNGQTTSDFQDSEGALKTITVVTENGDITIHQSD